jgi:hypothetical protein
MPYREMVIMESENTIFVNIPCYQDPELWETINNFYENAEYPDSVYFGITNQTSDPEFHKNNLQKFPNVQMHILTPGSLPGCQPARKKSHEFYNNQKYYLNMDSHMRSVKNWDTGLIEELEYINKENDKDSVLTGYVAAYDKDENGKDIIPEVDYTTVFYMSDSNINHFKEHGVPQFTSYPYKTDKPIKSPYISGHFFFTTSQAVLDAPFVTDIFFTEEEIFMSLRFFTAGYDIFNPQKTYVYHRYGRAGRPLFWQDFPESWYENEKKSKDFLNDLVENNIIDSANGLLKNRTLAEFEEYSGINFKGRLLSESVIKGAGG